MVELKYLFSVYVRLQKTQTKLRWRKWTVAVWTEKKIYIGNQNIYSGANFGK